MISLKLCEWINFLKVGWLGREWVGFNRTSTWWVLGLLLSSAKEERIATKNDDDSGTNNRQYYLPELTCNSPCNSGILPMIVGGKISSLSSPHENRPSRSVPEGPERAEKKGSFSSWSTLNSNWIFQSYHCCYVPSGLFHHVWHNSACKRWKNELERALRVAYFSTIWPIFRKFEAVLDPKGIIRSKWKFTQLFVSRKGTFSA